MGYMPQNIKFGMRTTPISKEITGGGFVTATSTGPGPWVFTDSQGWRHWIFNLVTSGTVTGTYSINIEATEDPNHILNYPGMAIRANSEGHADAAAIPAFVIVPNMNAVNTYQEFDRQVVAVRANLTANSIGGTGSVLVWASVAP